MPKKIAEEMSIPFTQKYSASLLRTGIALIKVVHDKKQCISRRVFLDMTLSGLHKIKCDKRESK